jgi:hypothetical protein
MDDDPGTAEQGTRQPLFPTRSINLFIYSHLDRKHAGLTKPIVGLREDKSRPCRPALPNRRIGVGATKTAPHGCALAELGHSAFPSRKPAAALQQGA